MFATIPKNRERLARAIAGRKRPVGPVTANDAALALHTMCAAGFEPPDALEILVGSAQRARRPEIDATAIRCAFDLLFPGEYDRFCQAF